MKSMNAMVRSLLADRLEREVSAIRSRHELDTLGLTPLDLVLVALDVEEIAGVHLPMSELAYIRTVGELISFLSISVVEQRRCATVAGT